MIIQHENKAHEATCARSEGQLQSDMAAAATLGGELEAAAIRRAELAHYKRIVESCKAHDLPYANFLPVLRELGAA